MLRNKLENNMMEVGMDIPFQEELNQRGKEAKTAFVHSQKCKKNRESRRKKFDKVRVLYWNLMFLLSGICIVSVGRLVYEVIQILKMQ